VIFNVLALQTCTTKRQPDFLALYAPNPFGGQGLHGSVGELTEHPQLNFHGKGGEERKREGGKENIGKGRAPNISAMFTPMAASLPTFVPIGYKLLHWHDLEEWAS